MPLPSPYPPPRFPPGIDPRVNPIGGLGTPQGGHGGSGLRPKYMPPPPASTPVMPPGKANPIVINVGAFTATTQTMGGVTFIVARYTGGIVYSVDGTGNMARFKFDRWVKSTETLTQGGRVIVRKKDQPDTPLPVEIKTTLNKDGTWNYTATDHPGFAITTTGIPASKKATYTFTVTDTVTGQVVQTKDQSINITDRRAKAVKFSGSLIPPGQSRIGPGAASAGGG